MLIIHQAHKHKIDQNSAKSCGEIEQHRPYQSGIFIQLFIHLSSTDSVQKYDLVAKFIANEVLSKSDFKSNLHPYKRLVTEIILCVVDYLQNRVGNSFFLSPTDLNEIEAIILFFNNYKSVGPYCVPIKLLKSLSKSSSESLTLIANDSFNKGIYPNKLKTAKVVVLH